MLKNSLIKQYNNINVYDIITKLHLKNIFEIPQITELFLNIGFKKANSEKKKMIHLLILLKLITNQQPISTKSSKNNIFLKIKKNALIGCKITLKKKTSYFFLEQLMLSNYNHFTTIIKQKQVFNFQLSNRILLQFLNLKTEFFKFQNIPSLDISFHTNSKQQKHLLIFLNSFLFFHEKCKNNSIGRV